MRWLRRVAIACCCGLLAACLNPPPSPPDFSGPVANWPAYGGVDAQHYSPLTQVNRDNIDQLEVAWTHNSGDVSNGRDGEWGFTSLQVTPIVANSSLYYCSPFGRVFALDPETGTERWVFDPQLKNKRSGLYPVICRGVSYWESSTPGDGECSKRILFGTRDAELIAIDADTGKACQDFGQQGRVALSSAVNNPAGMLFYPTSPPAVIDDIAVIGSMVPDNEDLRAPSGLVQAFNVIDGTRAWVWEPLPPNFDKPPGVDGYMPGTPNAWAPISTDPQNKLVFVPTGNPGGDAYGGERDGIDYYGSSTVALHAGTGEVAWHFQTVHHDVWDYDLPAQPQLFQIDGVGNGQPGILQAAKTGHIFLLDRHTGEPLYPVEERPVPQGGVAGELLSATQPFPTHPAPLHPAKLETGGFIGIDKYLCDRELAGYRDDGIFTPPSLQGSVQFPATTGGINWGATSIDPVNGLLFVNQMHYVMVTTLIPRDQYDELNPPTGGYPDEFYPVSGSAYGIKRTGLMSIFGAPCVKQPWGTFTAIDLKSGAIIWQKSLGTSRDQAPWPLWFNTGSPNTGGSLATAGGVVFIGATTDRYFRAIDGRTGEELWRESLPYAGNATPMSYRIGEDSRQFVVIAAGGHGWSQPGDALVAFALPAGKEEKGL